MRRKTEPRQANNSKKAKTSRLTAAKSKGAKELPPWERKASTSNDQAKKAISRETKSEASDLREEILSIRARIARIEESFMSTEEFEEDMGDFVRKKSHERCLNNFLSKNAKKKAQDIEKEDIREAFEALDSMGELVRFLELRASQLSQYVSESERFSRLSEDSEKMFKLTKRIEEASNPKEEDVIDQPVISDWEVKTMKRQIDALQEEVAELREEKNSREYRDRESYAIRQMMLRWFFLLHQGHEFNYADILRIMSDPEIQDPKEEEPLNASFCRSQDAERIYQESLTLPKVTEQKDYVLQSIWSAIAEHNQKCEIYDDLSPICPWLPTIKVVANTFFLDIGKTFLRRSPGKYEELVFQSGYHFFKHYNPQEFYLSEDESRKLIKDWNLSYTKKIGLKSTVKKTSSSVFTSDDLCSKKIADSEREEMIKSSVEGIYQVFGTFCEIRLKDEILREITEANL